MISIMLNGEEATVNEDRLDRVLEALGYGDALIATAVNGDFVPVSARVATVLVSGNQLEVIAPLQGG